MLPQKSLKVILTAGLFLFALPACTAVTAAQIIKFEQKSRMCRANATVDYKTPLIEAAEKGDLAEVKRLIHAGANVNDVYGYGESGRRTALIDAASGGHADIVRSLIEAKAELDLQDDRCETALMNAAEWNHPEVVSLLLKAGADWKMTNIAGKSALELALAREQTAVLKAFWEAGIRLKGRDLALALAAAACRDTDFARTLVDAGAKPDAAALFSAAKCGQAGVMPLFLAAQVNVNARDEYAKTALMLAADAGHLDAVRELLKAGADVNAHMLSWEAWNLVSNNTGKVTEADRTGETALILAARNGHWDVMMALMEAGADVNDHDERGWTPLMYAAHRHWHLGAVKYLLKAGADIQAKNADGVRAVDVLMEMTAVISSVGDAEFMRMLLRAGADVNRIVSDARDETPLMRAADEGNPEIIRMLVEAGANLTAEDFLGHTALMHAAYNGRPEAVQALLDAGADVHSTRHADGETLLMMALLPPGVSDSREPFERRLEVVKLLVKAGADVNAKNNEGKTVFDYADTFDNPRREEIRAVLGGGGRSD
jgi:FOG: Ankyrin repeat